MASRRHELSERQWELLSEVLPDNGQRGGQWRPHRELLNAMFWKLNTGASWRDLPERYGPWQTVYDRFQRWQRDGTLQRLLDRLQLRMDELGRIDWDTWCVDGSNIRAARPAAGAKKGARK
jgi:transposase